MKDKLYERYMDKARDGITLNDYVNYLPRFSLYAYLLKDKSIPDYLEKFFINLPFNELKDLDILNREYKFNVVTSLYFLNQLGYKYSLNEDVEAYNKYIDKNEVYKLPSGITLDLVVDFIFEDKFSFSSSIDTVYELKYSSEALNIEQIFYLLYFKAFCMAKDIEFSIENSVIEEFISKYNLDEQANEAVLVLLLAKDPAKVYQDNNDKIKLDNLDFDSLYILNYLSR